MTLILKGNMARDVLITSGGMAFVTVAAEMKNEDGTPNMVAQFRSVKAWGQQALICAARLKKGYRVRIEVSVHENTAPETRSEELQARYPRDQFEYHMVSCELLGIPAEKPVAAPAKRRAKKAA